MASQIIMRVFQFYKTGIQIKNEDIEFDNLEKPGQESIFFSISMNWEEQLWVKILLNSAVIFSIECLSCNSWFGKDKNCQREFHNINNCPDLSK